MNTVPGYTLRALYEYPARVFEEGLYLGYEPRRFRPVYYPVVEGEGYGQDLPYGYLAVHDPGPVGYPACAKYGYVARIYNGRGVGRAEGPVVAYGEGRALQLLKGDLSVPRLY